MWHRSILGCPSGPASMQAQSACGACETPPGPLLQVRSGEEADFAAMGIRFACPNGHKLHVKAFLAGKRGICPHCGVHFRVPSAEGPESESSSEVLAVTDVQPPPMQSPVARAAVAAIPHPQTPPVTSTADLFPQDPASVWYVRPTQGGQYGPASATVMRNWVLEGRVPPDAFVWSQGWTEWQRASEAIPRGLLEVAGRSLQAKPALAAEIPLATGPSPAGPTAVGSFKSGKEKMATVESYRQRQAHRRSISLVTWLGITSLLLLVALVYVVVFRR